MATASPPSPCLPSTPAPPCLADYLRQVPDPRSPSGRRHSLEAVLLLVVVAILSGRTHNQGIHEWGRGADRAVQEALGFKAGKTPAASTLHLILRAVSCEDLASQLRQWALAVLAQLDPTHAPFSIDGKTIRSSLKGGADVSHLISAFVGELGLTLDLERAVSEQPDQRSGELAAAPRLLLRLPLAGRTVVMDALYTQEPLAEALVAAGLDYVLPVKRNQPELHEELAEQFARPFPDDWQRDECETYDRAHGRQELRRLTLVAPPTGETLLWGAARQQFRLERYRWRTDWRGKRHYSRTVVYGVTSLGRSQADAARVLALVRGHWAIENRSHWIRDTLLREDESRISTGKIVKHLAALRCAALTLLHHERRVRGNRSVSSTLRALNQNPADALRLVGVGT